MKGDVTCEGNTVYDKLIMIWAFFDTKCSLRSLLDFVFFMFFQRIRIFSFVYSPMK